MAGGLDICMIGDGQMAAEHSKSIAASGGVLDTVVGRDPVRAEAFARDRGYRRWTTDFEEGLDAATDAAVIATPSFTHAALAIAALERGKHVLVEIPLAMTLAEGESVVAAAREAGRKLAACHPLRLRPDLMALRQRVAAGEETIQTIATQQFMRNTRVAEWRGRRSAGKADAWMDNLLWHNMAHSIDAGLWLVGEQTRRVTGWMSPLDELAGTPMSAFVGVETANGTFLGCTGSYHGAAIYQITIVTDREVYRFDQRNSTFAVGARIAPVAAPYDHLALVGRDFLAAIAEDRPPAVSGEDVLATLRVIQAVQDDWDARYDAPAINGRPTAREGP